MYEYFIGKIAYKESSYIVLETAGVAYRIQVPINATFPNTETVQLFTSFIVKEDSHTLYGFPTKGERDLFELLNTISGIGPKTALALIGHLEITTLQAAITNGNIQILSKIPGIGKKIAERVIMELKDKLKKWCKATNIPFQNNIAFDGITALIHLGYSHLQSQKAIQKALEGADEKIDLGTLISSALKKIR